MTAQRFGDGDRGRSQGHWAAAGPRVGRRAGTAARGHSKKEPGPGSTFRCGDGQAPLATRPPRSASWVGAIPPWAINPMAGSVLAHRLGPNAAANSSRLTMARGEPNRGSKLVRPQTWRQQTNQWRYLDSNQGQLGYEPSALTPELYRPSHAALRRERCGAKIRTWDLRVMSPTSCHCSTPPADCNGT